MRLDLRYGDGERSLILPGDVTLDYLEPSPVAVLDDPAVALGRALTSPVGSGPLSAQLDARQKVLVVIADPTRSGTEMMLPVLVEALDRMGVDRTRLSLLVARGCHRSMTKEERQFLRTGPLRGITIEEHDCDNSEKLSALLLTRRRTPVRVNRVVREADTVILLSPISFHYFAGYGGGRKLILPGCADRQSILANHRLSLSDDRPVRIHPMCRPGQLEKNPVSEDMAEALGALGNIFAVNFFTDPNDRLVFVNAGDPVESHLEACERFAASNRVASEPQAGVLVLSAGGSPYDLNLLQAHKALYHGCETGDGSVILFYARCEEGVGSESLAAAMEMEWDKFIEQAYRDYDLNNQAAVSLIGLTRRCRVGMVTELDASVVESAHMEPVENAEAFLAGALEQRATNRVTVMRYGARTLPYINRSESS
ncbi:MAG: nickel-dependent lactate racemase [Candidatus Krumholzibacteriota bacterium]|nr:nickel-dependent lactate racemase [Candidatus Krumholzibacteriota bacterium]